MSEVQSTSATLLLWGVAALTLPGQSESGDLYLVEPFEGGVLVAVVDGLGHGNDAAKAARVAVEILRTHASEQVDELVRRCHEALRSTRGVAMSLASFSLADRTMSWLGVGNVEGVLLRAGPGGHPPRERLLLRGGVVGYQLPRPRPSVLRVHPADTLVLVTDGVGARFADSLHGSGHPQQIADGILSEHAKGTDDALVLVARYEGSAG